MGKDGAPAPLSKQIIEASLEGEIQVNLDECETNLISGCLDGEARKKIKSEQSTFELETLRNRKGGYIS